MTRIVDVARTAGVSTATVSRVLNGKNVRPELAAAVRVAVEELGYVPDRTARSLRRRSSDVVALVLPDIENPFFTAVARGVEDVAREAGYSVVLCNTDDDPAKEEHYLAVAERENMAGVVVAPSTGSPEIAVLRARRRAVVVIDRRVGQDVDQVVFDNVALGRRVTRELVGRGFRRIACVTGSRTTITAVERADGWRDALDAAGLTCDGLLAYTDFRVDGGYDAMGGLLALPQPPDAVVATNNMVGVGVLRALADAHGQPAASPADTRRGGGPALGVGIDARRPPTPSGRSCTRSCTASHATSSWPGTRRTTSASPTRRTPRPPTGRSRRRRRSSTASVCPCTCVGTRRSHGDRPCASVPGIARAPRRQSAAGEFAGAAPAAIHRDPGITRWR